VELAIWFNISDKVCLYVYPLCSMVISIKDMKARLSSFEDAEISGAVISVEYIDSGVLLLDCDNCSSCSILLRRPKGIGTGNSEDFVQFLADSGLQSAVPVPVNEDDPLASVLEIFT